MQVQELRIKHRWNAIQQANDEMEEAKLNSKGMFHTDTPTVTPAGKCLYAHVICCFKSADKWTEKQKKEQKSYLKNTPT